MLVRAGLLVALAVSGCAADQYRAAGTPNLPRREAGSLCVHEAMAKHPSNPWLALGAPFGAVGALAGAAADPNPTPQHTLTEDVNLCMARYGWERR